MAASFFRGFLGSVPEQGEKDQQLLITRVHARRSLRSYRRTARAVQKAVDPNEPEEVTKERMRKLVTAELIDTERKYLEGKLYMNNQPQARPFVVFDLILVIISDLDRMQSCFIAPIRAKFGDNHNPEWRVCASYSKFITDKIRFCYFSLQQLRVFMTPIKSCTKN